MSVERLQMNHLEKKRSQVEKIDALVRKGNENLTCLVPHTCYICQKVTVNRSHLKKHLESFHRKTAQKFCDLCPKAYFSKDRLRWHMNNFHCKKKLACNVCDFKTTGIFRLRRHKIIHAEKVECKICNKYVSSLKTHLETTHKPKETCLVCQKMINKSNMKKHMDTHFKKAFKCKSCSEAFDNKTDLNK